MRKQQMRVSQDEQTLLYLMRQYKIQPVQVARLLYKATTSENLRQDLQSFIQTYNILEE